MNCGASYSCLVEDSDLKGRKDRSIGRSGVFCLLDSDLGNNK